MPMRGPEQIRSCVLLLEEKWIKKNLEFNLDFEEYKIEANEELLKEVWINLVDNAIKFSPEGEQIDIHIQEIGEEYQITVSNKGEELTEETQKKIFHKFYQADESHATQGNGIGLAIVKHIVNLHKGQIKVKWHNNIITFAVILPKVKKL